MDSTFRPYVGTEPYIFVSYARADKETVLPIVRALSEAGYRVWYDAGIPWTEEWPDEIADRLADCAVCVAFHSSASIASRHCKVELYYAMSKRRHILPVYLEDDVHLPSGLEMYLGPVQAVKLSRFDSIDAFVERLGQEAAFRFCREEQDGVTDNMRHVRILISSSIKELEIREISAFLNTLAMEYARYKVQLQCVIPQYTPRDMALKPGGTMIEEWFQEIRESEFFFLIVGERACPRILYDFETALKQFQATGRPRIVVFFLLTPGEFPDVSVLQFHDELKEQGYYFVSCKSLDEIEKYIHLYLLQGGAFEM